MIVTHNMKAMNAERQFNIVTSDKAKSAEKLSSGYQINRSADDAAGLAISEKMRHQIRGLDRGSANIEEGVGYCQVADGALNEMHDMLQRMNELCIQAANGTLSHTDRGYIDDEVQILKSEVERICRTTKFNEEYIFRCEDVIEEKPHDVYKLTFSGTPKDLFIYNTSYDADDKYAGVAFRGRRYTWDEINPYMYDKTTHTFREGEYSIQADDGTMLTLVCEQGAKLPQVSRKFRTSANGEGIYVNGDLVRWDNVKVAGDKYSFDYHGMTISYTKEAGDSFEDMMLKMTGTVWESTYETPVEGYAVDASFSFGTNYRFVSNKRIEVYLKNDYMPKYILHAEDINHGGTIPVHDDQGNFLRNEPFDGVWLEGTNEDGSPSGKVVYDTTTTGGKKLCAMTWDEFGFNCGFDNHDWGNLSTDIWSGADHIKDDPKPVYPPDTATSGSLGNDSFANYDPYNKFVFNVFNNNIAPPDNREHVEFFFSVINEVSKEQVINTLDGTVIGYNKITPHDHAQELISNGKISSFTKALNLTLDDEYNLGRDYENHQAQYMLKDYEQLTYSNGRFSISYGYDRKGGNMVLSGSPSYSAGLKNSIITGGVINGNKLSASNTMPRISMTLTGGNGSSLSIGCNYNISDFFSGGGATITETASGSGRYVKINNRYVEYRSWDASHQNLQRYNVDIASSAGQSLENYFTNTVYPDIANGTKVSLHTDDYPTGGITGEEDPQTAMITRWQTPFQHPHILVDEEVKEKPEYLRIQCSSNTIDNIYIQKQKLSVYRLGLLNVGTLSEMQATGCIDMVGAAISKVSSVRSLFGAQQNRLEHAYAINRSTHENTQSAESLIRDTNMAKEMIKFSNANILEQSGNSMLVQANQANDIVLSLLQ